MRSNFNERKEQKIKSYCVLASKNEKKSSDYYNNFKNLQDQIPMGQPILVGHHSEGRHRSHLNKIDNSMRKSIQSSDKANYYRRKAKSAENNNAIFSDDPEAVVKLKKKINGLEKMQEVMKSANKIIRKKISDEEKTNQLKEIGLNDNNIYDVFHPVIGNPGFQTFQISNNSANIRRLKKRLKSMQASSNLPEKVEFNDIYIINSKEHNRTQIFFNGKPPVEQRTYLKSNGFRWARSLGCWQRHLSKQAFWIASDFCKRFN